MTAWQGEPVRRPGTVTAVAVMGFILGGLCLVGLVWAVVQFAAPSEAVQQSGALADPLNRGWMMVGVPLKTVMGLAWIVTGVGLLRLRSWAKTLAVVLLIAEIVVDAVAGGVSVVVIGRMTFPSDASMPRAAADFARTAAMVGALLGVAVWLAYSVVMLALITRPSATEAFRQAQARVVPGAPYQAGPPRQAPPPVPPAP